MLTNYAEMDLENIGDYIAYVLLNPESAISTVKGIRRQVSELEYFPERNPLEDSRRWLHYMFELEK